jgi:hypothetical protein
LPCLHASRLGVGQILSAENFIRRVADAQLTGGAS